MFFPSFGTVTLPGHGDPHKPPPPFAVPALLLKTPTFAVFGVPLKALCFGNVTPNGDAGTTSFGEYASQLRVHSFKQRTILSFLHTTNFDQPSSQGLPVGSA
jgi:hypothetical protein